MTLDGKEQSSSGHKLGQLVGDWFQDFFVKPLLTDVAKELDLFLDYRDCKRNKSVRADKILWADEDGNQVDYDFVMELGGSARKRGIPVAFLECFWRRGSRHSKDKARDDSGKLMPMRATYPTARFLGIVASGEFTQPARELVESRKINLLYIPKAKVIESFQKLGLEMDYNDKAKEDVKAGITTAFEKALNVEMKEKARAKLRAMLGETTVRSYIASVKAALSSTPLEFRIVGQHLSAPKVFETVGEVTEFLSSDVPAFDFNDPTKRFSYQVSYSDGTEYERALDSMGDMRELHKEIAALADHMTKVLG